MKLFSYSVWASDLNQEYGDNLGPSLDVCCGKDLSFKQAAILRNEMRDHRTAAWVQCDSFLAKLFNSGKLIKKD